jgi:class 3 adenylate cyclase/tetratricopeptide (TPR) repeat protein
MIAGSSSPGSAYRCRRSTTIDTRHAILYDVCTSVHVRDDLMKCPKCQADNRVGIKFCEDCGAKLELACASCGAAIPPGKRFCGECGHNMALAPPAPPVELSFEEKLDKIQRYLPDGLTEKILAQRGKIEGERKQVTVMFCDAEGFSLLSERLGPEKVYSIMDEVFETLIHKVHEFGGTVNKMTGDGVMALFGAPIALEDAPQRAIRSALAIQREIARLSDRKKEETGNRPIRMRIGVHTGPVVVGSLGNDLRVEFTAVGDTVNLASRMEGLAEPGTVYVTDETFKLTEGLFRFEALGEKEVKGKEAPVHAYRVIAPSTRRARFDVSAEQGLTPFLGRERELELLLDGLERAKSGRGQAFSIMGEAGVGKSRLLYEFRKAVANEDVFFLEGRCLSYSQNVAYHPVIDLLKATFDIHEDDNDDRIKERVNRGLKDMGVDAASTRPFVLELLSVKDSGIDALNLTPEARKDKTLEALRRTVLKGSEARPLVMAIEDLHWVDKSSEETLKSLLDAISGAQVVLVFTYRPEFVHTWGTKTYHSQVNLMRLSNRETLAMAAHILGTEVIGPDLGELVLEKTEGIPFFVEEFMKSLKDLGMIEWKGGGYYLARDIKDLAIPSTIQDVIMARVDALPEGAKNVLQTGSAIGREFSCELIKRVTGVPQPEITTHLSALRDSELLYERGIFPQATYIFRHSLTQEVAYDSLLEKRKQEIHERVAQAIEELYPDRLEEFYEVLGHHYSMSHNHEKAYKHLRMSADKALSSLALWEAFRFYKEAVGELKELPETEANKRRGVETRLLMVGQMMTLGFPEDSLEILQEGERLARELDDGRSLAQLYGSMGFCHFVRADQREAIKCLEDAFRMAEATQDVELMASIGFQLCTSCFGTGLYLRVAEVAPRVIASLESARRESEHSGWQFNLYAGLWSDYGYALACLGRFDEGEAQCEEGLQLATTIDDPMSIWYSEAIYGWVLVLRGKAEKGIEHLQNAIRYEEEMRLVVLAGINRSVLGLAYLMLGDRETALKHIENGLEIARGSGPHVGLSTHYHLLGLCHSHAGEWEHARTCCETALELAQKQGETQQEGQALMRLGLSLGMADKSRFAEAEECILRGIRLVDGLGLRTFSSTGHLNLGELYADTGQKDKALETLKKAEAEFKDMGMDYWLQKTQEVLARVEG